MNEYVPNDDGGPCIRIVAECVVVSSLKRFGSFWTFRFSFLASAVYSLSVHSTSMDSIQIIATIYIYVS